MIKASLKKAASVPPTMQDTLIEGLLNKASHFPKTDGSSAACQGPAEPCVCSTLKPSHNNTQSNEVIHFDWSTYGTSKACQGCNSSSVEEDKHEASDSHSHPSWFSGWDGPWQLPCKVALMKTNGKAQCVVVSSGQRQTATGRSQYKCQRRREVLWMRYLPKAATVQ